MNVMINKGTGAFTNLNSKQKKFTLINAQVQNVFDIDGYVSINSNTFKIKYYPFSQQNFADQLNESKSLEANIPMSTLLFWYTQDQVLMANQICDEAITIKSSGSIYRLLGEKYIYRNYGLKITCVNRFSDFGVKTTSFNVDTQYDNQLIFVMLQYSLGAANPVFINMVVNNTTTVTRYGNAAAWIASGDPGTTIVIYSFQYQADKKGTYNLKFTFTQVGTYVTNFSCFCLQNYEKNQVPEVQGDGQYNKTSTNINNIVISRNNVFTCVCVRKASGSTLVLNKNSPDTQILTQLQEPYPCVCTLDVNNTGVNGFNFVGGRNLTQQLININRGTKMEFRFMGPSSLQTKYLMLRCPQLNHQTGVIAYFTKDKVYYSDKFLSVRLDIQEGSDMLSFEIVDQDNRLQDVTGCLQFML